VVEPADRPKHKHEGEKNDEEYARGSDKYIQGVMVLAD
jgi:hypothetical protein